MISALSGLFRSIFAPAALAASFDGELRMRRPDRLRNHIGRYKRKTAKGATHAHSAPGSGCHRRAYLPAVSGGRLKRRAEAQEIERLKRRAEQKRGRAAI